MKNVRIMYKKIGDARFVSHLDMNRYWARILRKADIPLWFTEGFNPHIYTNFAFPLSLGFESEGEILDVRLVEDYPLELIKQRVNEISPPFLHIVDVWEPLHKFTDISFAEYKIALKSDNKDIFSLLNEFLSRNEITVTRTNKKGVEKQINIAPDINKPSLEAVDGGVELKVILPAGNIKNINPTLLVGAFADNCGVQLDAHYTRVGFLDSTMKRFM